MENASKALIMAGAILIGVLLLALMVYFFSVASGLRGAYSKNVNNTRITEFNTKFTKYNITETEYKNSEEKSYVTIRDIVTLANYAKEFNGEMQSGDSDYISVKIVREGDISGNITKDNNKLLSDHISCIYVAEKNGVTYYDTGRIESMTFKEIKHIEHKE